MEKNEIGPTDGGHQGKDSKALQIVGADGQPLTIEVKGKRHNNNEPAARWRKSVRAIWQFICGALRVVWTAFRDLNFWQAAATIALVFVGIAQFRVNDRQADIMKSQSKIMKTQADISAAQNRDARTTQRAWLEVTTIKPGPPPDDFLHLTIGEPAEVDAIVTNIGSTPALHMFAKYRLDEVANGEAPKTGRLPGQTSATGIVFPKRQEILSAKWQVFIFPTMNIEDHNISKEDLSDWNNGLTYFAFYGEIDYWDIFNVPHWTQFCYVLTAPGKQSATRGAEKCLTKGNGADNNQDPRK